MTLEQAILRTLDESSSKSFDPSYPHPLVIRAIEENALDTDLATRHRPSIRARRREAVVRFEVERLVRENVLQRIRRVYVRADSTVARQNERAEVVPRNFGRVEVVLSLDSVEDAAVVLDLLEERGFLRPTQGRSDEQ